MLGGDLPVARPVGDLARAAVEVGCVPAADAADLPAERVDDRAPRGGELGTKRADRHATPA